MENDDAELEIVRRTVQDDTNRSFRRTFLTCVLIMTARRRRAKAAAASGAACGVVLAHYWHPLVSLLSHLLL